MVRSNSLQNLLQAARKMTPPLCASSPLIKTSSFSDKLSATLMLEVVTGLGSIQACSKALSRIALSSVW